MKNLNIGKDFSPDPSGRFRSDGNSSGEAFREDCFKKVIENLEDEDVLNIILDDDVEGYGSSFLVEGFAGMVKYGYITGEELLKKIKFSYNDEDFGFYKDKIIDYINQATFNSKEYLRNS